MKKGNWKANRVRNQRERRRLKPIAKERIIRVRLKDRQRDLEIKRALKRREVIVADAKEVKEKKAAYKRGKL